MLGFKIDPKGQFGLIIFDVILVHAVINLLYGGKVDPDEPLMAGVGQAGIKIASKVAEICLLVFQDALNEQLNIDVNVSHLSTSLYSVFNQKLDKCCNFAFSLSLDAVSGGEVFGSIELETFSCKLLPAGSPVRAPAKFDTSILEILKTKREIQCVQQKAGPGMRCAFEFDTKE